MRIALYIILSSTFFYYQVNVGAGVLGDITNISDSKGKKTVVSVSGVKNTLPVCDEEVDLYDNLLSEKSKGNKKFTDQETQTDTVRVRYFKHPRGSDVQVSPGTPVDEFSPADNSENDFIDDQNNIRIPAGEVSESSTSSSCVTAPYLIQAFKENLQGKDKSTFNRTYPLRSGVGGSDNNGSHEISDVTRKSERRRGTAHRTCEENSDLPCQTVWR